MITKAAPAPGSRPAQANAGPPRVSTAVPGFVRDVLGKPARPLDARLQQEMELRFQHDFSRVRIHDDDAAARSTAALRARAYTVGHDIAIARGAYAPATTHGRRLIAHELAHVVQQERGGPTPPSEHACMVEQAADAAASAFVASHDPIHVRGASAPGLARQPLTTNPDPNARKEPRSLRETLNLAGTDFLALQAEINLIDEWLIDNPVGPVSDHLRIERNRLQAAIPVEIQVAAKEFRAKTAKRREREEKRRRIQDQIAAVVNAVNVGRIPKWMPVFPFLPSSLLSVDAAAIMAWREGDKIVVRQLTGQVAHNRRFKKDVRRLPGTVFSREGLTLRPRQLVGVRRYDEGEKVEVIFAEQLLDYARVSDRAVWKNIAVTAAAAIAAPYVVRAAGAVPTVGRSSLQSAAHSTAMWAARNPVVAQEVLVATVSTSLAVAETGTVDPVDLLFNLAQIKAAQGGGGSRTGLSAGPYEPTPAPTGTRVSRTPPPISSPAQLPRRPVANDNAVVRSDIEIARQKRANMASQQTPPTTAAQAQRNVQAQEQRLAATGTGEVAPHVVSGDPPGPRSAQPTVAMAGKGSGGSASQGTTFVFGEGPSRRGSHVETFPPQRKARRGIWSGMWGDSNFTPDNQEALKATGYRPIPYRSGYPDFRQFARERVLVPRSALARRPGESLKQLRRRHNWLADRQLAINRSWLRPDGTPDVAEAEAFRTNPADRSIWHHVEHDNVLLLVPEPIHRAAQHVGGVAEPP